MTDANPATCTFDKADDWRVDVSNAVASLSTDFDRPLFSDSCTRVTYRSTRWNTGFRIRPSAPVALKPFDTFTIWVYGNNAPVFGQRNPTPPTDIHAEFKTADGKVWSAYVGKVQHFEWHHSPQLLASMVAEELRTGKFTYPQEAL